MNIRIATLIVLCIILNSCFTHLRTENKEIERPDQEQKVSKTKDIQTGSPDVKKVNSTPNTGEVKADTAKKPAEVKIAQAQEQKEVVKVPKKEVLDAIETAKKYEIEIPDMTCPEHSVDVVNKRVTDDGYRVFYSKYGQKFTLLITDGGGFAVYNGIRELKGSIFNLPDPDTLGLAFWSCVNHDEDETPGYQRVRAFEVPYKKIVNGQEVQRSLIVIASVNNIDLIARDDSDGKWKIVGTIFTTKEVILNFKTDKPTIGIEIYKDDATGQDLIDIMVISQQEPRGLGKTFWSAEGWASKGVEFSIVDQ